MFLAFIIRAFCNKKKKNTCSLSTVLAFIHTMHNIVLHNNVYFNIYFFINILIQFLQTASQAGTPELQRISRFTYDILKKKKNNNYI